ncbi:MAG: hypothetical protein RL173_691 [Fibrobacterota bacterium]|jgi:alpha-amylase
MRDVMLHAFNWPYREIADNARAISDAGYGAVLFPPPFYSDPEGTEWWQVYQPKDYRVLRSNLGRKTDLVQAMAALKAAGVHSYVDVVFNHMANESRPDKFHFPGAAELAKYATERAEFEKDLLYGNLDSNLFTERDFHPARDIVDWSDSEEIVNRSLSGLPDLVLSIAVVREQIQCLKALAELGFEGFRIDAVKHLPTDHILAVFRSEPVRGKFLFGETLTFDEIQNREFLWPIVNETGMPCYDFPLQQAMLRAFSPQGSMRVLSNPVATGNALPPFQSVTFTVTHDVPNNDGFRGMLLSPHDEYLANAYVLGRDGGVPLVYSDHAESAVKYPEDRKRWEHCWKRYDIVQMVKFHNAVHGMSQRTLWEDDGFLVFSRGDRGIVAINKTRDWVTMEVTAADLMQGRYRCQLHQHDLYVRGDRLPLAIPPHQAQMWLWEE